MSNTTATPADLRKSLVSQGEAQIEASKNEALEGAIGKFATISTLIDNGTLPEKTATILSTLFEAINNPDTRDGAIRHLTSGTGLIDDKAALQALLNSNTLSVGQKRAMERLVVSNHPEHIVVDASGTPTETVDLRSKNDKLEQEARAITDGKSTPDEVKKATATAVAKLVEPLKVIKKMADEDWKTIGLLNNRKDQHDDDTVRRQTTRKELQEFQNAAKAVEKVIADNKPASA